MTEPYAPGDEGEGYCGYGTISDDDAYDYMRKAIDGNHQLLAHTNGDAAADQYLRVYKRALEDSRIRTSTSCTRSWSTARPPAATSTSRCPRST